ncbi:oxygenase MpaB family protein [Nocardia sp. NPDC051030]|uniref:oxygenase MpaB family protein n=1 Tax=Nocardia sp. NPDC051030 TaxID=3155162 RepID=UPI00343B315A
MRDGQRVGVFRDQDGILHEVIALCTHGQYELEFDVNGPCWTCPQHGARFAVDGRVLNGPAIESLEQAFAGSRKDRTVTKKGIAHSVAGDRHPFDYCHREGMTLRPNPEAAPATELWLTPQYKKMFSPWISMRFPPAPTRLTSLFEDHRWQGDELMDAVVLSFRQTGMSKGRRMLDQALDDGIGSVSDAQPELVKLFKQLDNPPGWFDPEVWERGRQLSNNASRWGKQAMLANDFLGTFVGREVSQATGQSGRFRTDPWRRVLESLTWFNDVTRPGAVDRRSPVFKDIVRVRLMHAQARAALRQEWGDEHFARHGNPISNSATMGAAVSFAVLAPLADHARGRHISVTDLDAIMSYWSYIAHLMGVADELIPRNAIEALEMVHYLVVTAGGPTEWTADLVNAACDHGLSENPLVRRLQIEVIAPVFGLLAAHGGAGLVRALLQDSPLATVRLQPWQGIAEAAGQINVLQRRLGDHLPRAEARTARRAQHGDTQLLVALLGALASRNGVSGTPYDHHDTSVETATGSDEALVSRRVQA